MSLPSGRKHPGTQYGTIRRFRYNPSDSMQNGTLSTMRNGPIHPATKSRRSPLGNFRTCSVITGPAPAKPHYSRTTKKHFCKQFSPDYCMEKTGFAATRTVPPKIPARINKPSLHRQPKVSPRCRHHLSNIIRYEQIHRCSIKREPPDIGWLSTSLCCVGAQGFEPRTLCL